mgnify:CR=1 FL=1
MPSPGRVKSWTKTFLNTGRSSKVFIPSFTPSGRHKTKELSFCSSDSRIGLESSALPLTVKTKFSLFSSSLFIASISNSPQEILTRSIDLVSRIIGLSYLLPFSILIRRATAGSLLVLVRLFLIGYSESAIVLTAVIL